MFYAMIMKITDQNRKAVHNIMDDSKIVGHVSGNVAHININEYLDKHPAITQAIRATAYDSSSVALDVGVDEYYSVKPNQANAAYELINQGSVEEAISSLNDQEGNGYETMRKRSIKQLKNITKYPALMFINALINDAEVNQLIEIWETLKTDPVE